MPTVFEEGNGSGADTASTGMETAGSADDVGVGVEGTWGVGGRRNENAGEVGLASAVGIWTGVDGNRRNIDGEVGFTSSGNLHTPVTDSGNGGLVASGDCVGHSTLF